MLRTNLFNQLISSEESTNVEYAKSIIKLSASFDT